MARRAGQVDNVFRFVRLECVRVPTPWRMNQGRFIGACTPAVAEAVADIKSPVILLASRRISDRVEGVITPELCCCVSSEWLINTAEVSSYCTAPLRGGG